jgi:hypothetical protein
MMLSAKEEINLCTDLLVILLAIYHNSLRQRKYLKCTALVHPKKSAWQHLLDNGDSSSFLLLTGVNHRAFNMLLDIVIPPKHCLCRHSSMCDRLLKLSNIYTSLCQASKWGIRGLQGSFPQCKKRLLTNNLQRRKILESIIFVNNFRTEVVGYSQIQTVFDPEYERSITLEGYNQIAQYYLHLGDYVTDEDLDDNDDDNEDHSIN